MAKSTADVETLVIDTLDNIRKPYGTDVIEDVFVTIEKMPALLARYQSLGREFGPDILNQWIGKYTRRHVHMTVAGHATPTRTNLIDSYSRLTVKRQVIMR